MNRMIMSSILLAAIALSGCGGGGGGSYGSSPNTPAPAPAPTPTPMPSSVSFTGWSKATFGSEEVGAPSEFATVEFNFDSDEDPTAYSDLIPAGN